MQNRSVETQWRDWWKRKCDYSVALYAPHIHWRCQWGLREQGWSNSNSSRGIAQQVLGSRGRLSGGQKSVQIFVDCSWLVCSDCIVLRAWYDQICMRIVTWSLWNILYTDIWGFQLQAFPLKNCVNVCEFLLFHVCIAILI